MTQAKILIVDDLKTNILALSMILKQVDAELVTAQSGNEALQKVLEHDISIILLDVNMPEMDGFEVAEFLKEDEATRHIPIIFVTAMDRHDGNSRKGYLSGAVDFIYKPIDSFVLLSKVNVFLDLWRLRAGLDAEIEQRKENEEKIRYLSDNDLLTGLCNRRGFHVRLKSEIARSKRSKEMFALLFLDLDGFKKINDSLGHEAGDYLLKELSKLFKNSLRNSDFIGRYGGDEFVVLLTGIKHESTITQKIEELIQLASQEFMYDTHVMKVSVSIGVALYPEHAQSDTKLLSYADTAMYLAKEEGKNCFRFYTNELNQKLKRELLLDEHLKYALARDEFELYFQPVIDLQKKEVVGAEALIRWQKNKTLGFVSPEEFIPITESNGLIYDIGLWVLEETLQLLDAHPQLYMAINASSLQFMNDSLYSKLKENVASGRLDPSHLEVEITERLLLDNIGSPKNYLLDISKLGLSLSIDDFGTGYSSLSYLKSCPVNTVKIDKSFVSNIPDASNEALCKAIISMADALHLKVIAEGIETEFQKDFLTTLGCDYSQGYYFAKPLEKEAFLAFVAKGIK